MLKSIFYILGIAIIILGIYFSLIKYQSWKMSDEINQIMSLPRESVEFKVDHIDNSWVYYKVPVPNIFEAFIND